MGQQAYPEAKNLFITADAGGSNGYRARAWKVELQKFADDSGLRIQVSHFPPGTSKWNKIERRLFCHITQEMARQAIATADTIMDLIGNTRTEAGLRVKAKLDLRKYSTGVEVSETEMHRLSLRRTRSMASGTTSCNPAS